VTSSHIAPETYDRFKWRLLADATHGLGLWEPLWAANVEFAALAPRQREDIVVCALLELEGEGLIRFVRRPLIGPWPSAEVADLGAVLAHDEVKDAIQQDWWRKIPLERPPGDSSIWLEATSEAGNKLNSLPRGSI